MTLPVTCTLLPNATWLKADYCPQIISLRKNRATKFFALTLKSRLAVVEISVSVYRGLRISILKIQTVGISKSVINLITSLVL